MGWTNYLIDKERKVALEVGKYDDNDREKSSEEYEELINYLSSEEPQKEVITYLFNKIGYHEYHYLMINLFQEFYGGYWEIIGEEEFNKVMDDYKVVNRKY